MDRVCCVYQADYRYEAAYKSAVIGKEQNPQSCMPILILQGATADCVHFLALQAAALQRWRTYAAQCRRKAGRCRMACALALRHAGRRLHRRFAAWRGQAAAQAHRRAAGAATLQRATRARLRRCVFVWRLAALRQARPAS